MSGNKKNNKKGMMLVFWLIGLIVLVILFLVNKNKITANLKDTQFFQNLFNPQPEAVEEIEKGSKSGSSENSAPKPQVLEKTDDAETVPQTGDGSAETEPAQKVQIDVAPAEQTAETKPETAEPAKDDSGQVKTPEVKKDTKKAKESKPGAEPKKKNQAPAIAAVQMTNIKLYFMFIDGDGSVTRREAVRSMKKSDSPLTDAVNALIAGPVYSEASLGDLTLIPEGTKLLSANVRNRIATLNFSEEFEFNKYGVEGYLGQLEQIVYTATSFSTIDSVQILVEGQKKEYLGSEGVWIGSPLNRNNFNK